MLAYIIRRILLIIPTLLAIMTINFFIIQTSPGGPVERMVLQLSQEGDMASQMVTKEQKDVSNQNANVSEKKGFYKGSSGIDARLIEDIKKLYGFDKPLIERYFLMLYKYASFDFGDSFFKNASVIELIKQKLPVSVSLGVWSTLLIYLISIPLGIKKALKHGSRFDIYSSTIVVVANAIPGFLFAILLVIVFAGGNYLDWFPLRGLVSENFESLSFFGKIKDYFWHLTLPIIAMSIGGFATLTMLTKNSFLDEISKQYVTTARAKGLGEKRILYAHVFRNAMLIIISGFPSVFIGMFFTGSLLIEVIFSLDGIGLLGFEATMYRDYPIMFASLYIFTLLALVMNLISDLTYTFVDPRINFERF